MKDVTARVKNFLDERERMKGIDTETITAINGLELRVSDLRALLVAARDDVTMSLALEWIEAYAPDLRTKWLETFWKSC